MICYGIKKWGEIVSQVIMIYCYITEIVEMPQLSGCFSRSWGLQMHQSGWQIHLNIVNAAKPGKAIRGNKICIEFG